MEVKPQHLRPRYLNLLKIKQPLPAIVSILHRISGVLLFFPGIPLLLYSLQLMLDSESSFHALYTCLNHPASKMALMIVLWLFLHHFCAGIRYLALDLHYGIALTHARTSSKIVVISSIILTLMIGLTIW